MNTDESTELQILHQDTGRFDRRFKVGPACWPHFDLLWVHEGKVELKIGSDEGTVNLNGPKGVLIFPDAPFEGNAVGGPASASVCHFSGDAKRLGLESDCQFLLPDQENAYHIENLIRLSLAHLKRSAPMDVRIRLLRTILDCFSPVGVASPDSSRVNRAWSFAEPRLADIRGLADIAASVGMSESGFRNLHRQQRHTPAGRHLQEMRLLKAERLLATTGLSLSEISTQIGYAHTESFSAAFSKSRGKTPGAYRRWCKRLA